jgi:hypothetical protein
VIRDSLPDKEAKWITEGEAYFRESKIDLAAAKFLAGSTVPGMERRRLYFLQQALEKAVRSFMPIMVLAFRSSTRMAAYRMEFDEGKNVNQAASAILRARIERFAHLCINSEKGIGPAPTCPAIQSAAEDKRNKKIQRAAKRPRCSPNITSQRSPQEPRATTSTWGRSQSWNMLCPH